MSDPARWYVLILIPNGGGFPAVVGGYETHDAARKAGEAALRWPANLSDEDFAAYHENAAINRQHAARPVGQPPPWLDFSVIPGAATAAPGRETMRMK